MTWRPPLSLASRPPIHCHTPPLPALVPKSSPLKVVIRKRHPRWMISTQSAPSVGDLSNRIHSYYGQSIFCEEIQHLPDLQVSHDDGSFEQTLHQKIQNCIIMCDFTHNYERTIKAKKQNSLESILNLAFRNSLFKFCSVQSIEEIFEMLQKNIIRDLPTPPVWVYGNLLDPEVQTAGNDPSWAHREFCYAIFIKYLDSSDINNSIIERQLTKQFIIRLSSLFHSTDHRERAALKDVFVRIYARFSSVRRVVVKRLQQLLFDFVYESRHFIGAPEVLETLGQVLRHMDDLLSPRHLELLMTLLIPMYFMNSCGCYQKNLLHCVTAYAHRDPALIPRIVRKLVSEWPDSSGRAVNMLPCLFEMISLLDPSEFPKIERDVTTALCKSLCSPDFRTAQTVLQLWKRGDVMQKLAKPVMSRICPLVADLAKSHWNDLVRETADVVLMSSGYEEQSVQKKQSRSAMWSLIAEKAAQNSVFM